MNNKSNGEAVERGTLSLPAKITNQSKITTIKTGMSIISYAVSTTNRNDA